MKRAQRCQWRSDTYIRPLWCLPTPIAHDLIALRQRAHSLREWQSGVHGKSNLPCFFKGLPSLVCTAQDLKKICLHAFTGQILRQLGNQFLRLLFLAQPQPVTNGSLNWISVALAKRSGAAFSLPRIAWIARNSARAASTGSAALADLPTGGVGAFLSSLLVASVAATALRTSTLGAAFDWRVGVGLRFILELKIGELADNRS